MPGGPVYLYLSGETSGPSRFDNLQTGSEKPSPLHKRLSAKNILSSYPDFDAGHEWPWSYSRESVLWRELSVHFEYNRRAAVFEHRAKLVIFDTLQPLHDNFDA